MSTTVLCEEVNLCLQAGDTLAFNLHVTLDGVDEDITGWIFFLTVKRNKSDSDGSAKIDMEVSSHTDPTAGETLIQVEKEDTEDWTAGPYWYAIVALKPDGYEFTVQHGRLQVEKRVKVAVT